jgi:hypothetical protein
MIPVQRSETVASSMERYVFTIPLRLQGPSKCNDMHLPRHSQGTDPSLSYTACHSRPASYIPITMSGLAEELAMYQSKCSRWLAFATDIHQVGLEGGAHH